MKSWMMKEQNKQKRNTTNNQQQQTIISNNEKMALIQMGSTPEAVEALVGLHLYPISETAKIRVSFSKSSI